MVSNVIIQMKRGVLVLKQPQSIFCNFIMNIILTMSSFFFPLITFPYVSRILLPVGTGKVSFAASVINYFLLIAQLGIPTYGIRACAKVREDKEKLNKIVQEILLISVIMCIVAYVLFLIALFSIPRLYQERKLMVVTSSMIVFTTFGVEWFFKAMEMYSYITWRSIIFKCIALVAMFLLVREQKDYVIYGAISIFASSASNLLNFFYLHKFIDIRKRVKVNFSAHIKPIFIFFAMSCATTVYLNLDTTMLGFMKTDADVGYYNAAVKIKNMLVSIVTSLGAVLLPRVTVYIEKNENEKFYNLSIKAISFVLFLAVPLLVYFLIFAKPCVLLLSGEEYQNAVLPMQLMMPTLLFIGLTNIMGMQIMVPMGKESKVLASVVAGAITDLILNAILIPRFSVSGAAIGTVTAEIVVFTYQYFCNRKIFHDLFSKVCIWKVIVSALIAACASVYILQLCTSYWILLIISWICFMSIYMICLMVFKEKFVIELFKRLKEFFRLCRKGDKI